MQYASRVLSWSSDTRLLAALPSTKEDCCLRRDKSTNFSPCKVDVNADADCCNFWLLQFYPAKAFQKTGQIFNKGRHVSAALNVEEAGA